MPTANQQMRMRQPKRVSFNESVRVRPIKGMSSEMTATEKSQIYLSRDDIDSIHHGCRELCEATIKKARSLSASTPAKSLEEHCIAMIESDDRLRGFELRLSPSRKKNKSMVCKMVIECYKHLKTLPSMCSTQRELTLARAYMSLSICSLMRAIITGQCDMMKSYQPNTDINVLSNSISRIVSLD